jgi:hypothetical protein
LSRAASEKAAQAAIRADEEKFDAAARDWGYRLGSHLYDAYLAGKISLCSLRRLFLAHLQEPGLAPKVCATLISKMNSNIRRSCRNTRN